MPGSEEGQRPRPLEDVVEEESYDESLAHHVDDPLSRKGSKGEC